jgi:hypothetical protein
MPRILAALALLLAGCTQELTLPSAPGTGAPGSLSGTAVTARPGRSDRVPAAGAVVTVLGGSLVTKAGQDGRFLLEGIVQTRGTLLLRLDLDGDQIFDRQLSLRLEDLHAGPGRQLSVGELTVGQNARVSGRILLGDDHGTGGHANTTVYVPGGPYLALTADDGSWTLADLPEGPVDIAVLRTGYQPWTWDGLQLQGGEDVQLRDLQLPPAAAQQTPTGSLSGTVVALGGTPAGTSAALVDTQERATAVPVAQDGSFHQDGLKPDLYTLVVSRPGCKRPVTRIW